MSREPPAAKMHPPPVAISRGADERPAPGEPPFMGLRSFEEADADRFFGREMVAARLVGHCVTQAYFDGRKKPPTR